MKRHNVRTNQRFFSSLLELGHLYAMGDKLDAAAQRLELAQRADDEETKAVAAMLLESIRKRLLARK